MIRLNDIPEFNQWRECKERNGTYSDLQTIKASLIEPLSQCQIVDFQTMNQSYFSQEDILFVVKCLRFSQSLWKVSQTMFLPAFLMEAFYLMLATLPNLTHLNISASITTSFAQLPKSLEVLQINQITSTESERLCDYFIKSPKLKRLELGQMKSNHQSIRNVFKSLLNLQDLTHFTAYLGYPEFVYADLKRFLQLNNHLASLTISEPHLRCLKSFNNSLIFHQCLKKLNLEFIAIDTDAMICLTQLLINSKVLKQLYIKVIPDNPTLNDFGVLNITQGLNNLPSTQSIPNHPSTDLMPSLLDGLSLNTTISYVSINSNLIETTDSWILDKALSNINRINPNFMLNNQNIFDYDTELRIFMNRQAKHLLQVSRYLLLLESIVRRDVMYLIQEFFILPYFSIDRLLLRNVLLQRSSIGELLQIEYDSFDCSELIRFSSIWNTNKV